MFGDVLVQVVLAGLSQGAVLGLMALGFGVIRSTVRVLHVAHGDLAAASVLIAVLALVGRTPTAIAPSGPTSAALVALVVAVAMASSVAVGFVLSPALNEPLWHPAGARTTRPVTFVVGAFAVALAIRSALTGVVPPRNLVVPDPLRLDRIDGGAWQLPGGTSVPVRAVVVLVVALLVGVAVERLVVRSRAGLAMRAMADDVAAAVLCGVSARKAIIAAFGVSGLLAGVAAVLWAPQRALSVDDGALFGLEVAAAALLGGARGGRGPLYGGLAVGLVQALTVYWWGAGFYDIAPLSLLVILIALQHRRWGPDRQRSAVRLSPL